MSKRSATRELNHDNWNDDDVEEEAGNWKPASSEAIQGRVIKQARRRLAADNQDEDKPNAFAKFAGFSTKAQNSTGLFSFLSQTKPPTPTSAPEKKAETESSEKESSSEKEYLASLRVLNESVTTWITDHVKKNPCCVLTPIFQDYKKHLTELESKKDSKKETVSAPSTATASEEKETFKFGSSLTQNESSKSNFFSFSSSSSSNTLPTEAPAPTFSFGLGSKPFASSTEEKKEGAAAAATPFSFSFGSLKPAAVPAKTESNAEKEEQGDGEDEDAPPKVEVKEVKEDDAFYSTRCKLFYKKDSSYAEKGVGTMHLKKTKDAKTQLVMRADTSLGHILLNILLQPQMTTQRVGKNNVMLVCVPNPPIDPKNPSSVPLPMLLRVKTDTDADELLNQLNEAKETRAQE